VLEADPTTESSANPATDAQAMARTRLLGTDTVLTDIAYRSSIAITFEVPIAAAPAPRQETLFRVALRDLDPYL
jgi:hypothetical protein